MGPIDKKPTPPKLERGSSGTIAGLHQTTTKPISILGDMMMTNGVQEPEYGGQLGCTCELGHP